MPAAHLLIPGPVEADDDVLDAISQQTLPHYGPAWMALFNETVGMLKRLFETQGDALLMPGPGSAAVESGISSLVPRGHSVCVLENGFFGSRMVGIVEACGLRPWVVSAPLGQPVDPGDVRRHLREWLPVAQAEGQPIEALALCYHETGTGVLNPLEEIAAVAHEFGLALIVDAVAAFGGVRIPVDEWGIDVCVGVPNKCLGVPPGLALVSVSQRAWEMAHANPTPHGWYLSLKTWAWFLEEWGDWHPYPTTMPTNNVVAVNQGLKKVFEEGVEAHFASFRNAAGRVREGMAEMGFTLFPDAAYAAPVISALNCRPGVDAVDMQHFLLDEHGLMIAGGLGELKGKIFRIGHMGRGRDPEVIEALLAAVRGYVAEKASV